MRFVSAEEVSRLTPWRDLVAALSDAFARGEAGCTAPPRAHHAVPDPNGPDRTLLIMPAWGPDAGAVVKLAMVAPGPAAKGHPAVQAQVLVSDPATGAWTTVIDGGELTARRTAAASALAASHLARKDAATLLMVGAGRLAPNLIAAHAAVRPIRKVLVWARKPAKARDVIEHAESAGFMADGATDLEAAVGEADVISCATLSEAPLVEGAWLRPGTHVDLVGAFRPGMRETDGAAVARAEVYVDTRPGARGEAGDLLQAEAEGAFSFDDIRADLFELCSGAKPGRTDDDAITLFKSVGASIEDYAAAMLAAKAG